MEQVRQVQKKYCSRAMLMAFVAALIFLVAGYKEICRGLVLGAVFSSINFVLMGRGLPDRIKKEKGKASRAALRGIIIRYAILAIPLVMAIKFKRFDVLATAAGLFMVQLAILADHFFRLLPSFRRP